MSVMLSPDVIFVAPHTHGTLFFYSLAIYVPQPSNFFFYVPSPSRGVAGRYLTLRAFLDICRGGFLSKGVFVQARTPPFPPALHSWGHGRNHEFVPTWFILGPRGRSPFYARGRRPSLARPKGSPREAFAYPTPKLAINVPTQAKISISVIFYAPTY